MPKQNFKKGTTSKTVKVFIQSATTGNPITGIAYNSVGLTAYYIKEGSSSATAITLASGTLGTWSSGGFAEVDATNMPGLYELGIPNAALTSANTCHVYLTGYSGMVPVIMEIQLENVDNQDAVRYGMTALPNANASASGGLPTFGTSSGQITLSGGAVTVGTNSDKTGYSLSQSFPSNFSSLAINGSGLVKLDLTQAVPTSNTAETVGDALNAARADGFGKWVKSGTTVTLYANDGTTAVRSFTLDSSTSPTSRT